MKIFSDYFNSVVLLVISTINKLLSVFFSIYAEKRVQYLFDRTEQYHVCMCRESHLNMKSYRGFGSKIIGCVGMQQQRAARRVSHTRVVTTLAAKANRIIYYMAWGSVMDAYPYFGCCGCRNLSRWIRPPARRKNGGKRRKNRSRR